MAKAHPNYQPQCPKHISVRRLQRHKMLRERVKVTSGNCTSINRIQKYYFISTIKRISNIKNLLLSKSFALDNVFFDRMKSSLSSHKDEDGVYNDLILKENTIGRPKYKNIELIRNQGQFTKSNEKNASDRQYNANNFTSHSCAFSKFLYHYETEASKMDVKLPNVKSNKSIYGKLNCAKKCEYFPNLKQTEREKSSANHYKKDMNLKTDEDRNTTDVANIKLSRNLGEHLVHSDILQQKSNLYFGKKMSSNECGKISVSGMDIGCRRKSVGVVALASLLLLCLNQGGVLAAKDASTGEYL